MESNYLMMDVGGNGIKAAILDASGTLNGEIRWFPARSREDHETIFSNFADIILQMETELPDEDSFCKIGMAFPGPFDYRQGISLMQGLDKYDSIYGMDIQKEIKNRLEMKNKTKSRDDCRFLFLHDVEAFALGAGTYGPASGCEKIFNLCIGTGAGSAFIEHGKVIRERKDVPPRGWIYNTAFRDGVIDDYISIRGLLNLTTEQFLYDAPDGRQDIPDGASLAVLAAEGEERALEVFRRFGIDVAEAVIPFLQEFKPDGCIIGGQIAKSFPYFGRELLAFCKGVGIRVYPVSDTSRWTLMGLYEKFCREER